MSFKPANSVDYPVKKLKDILKNNIKGGRTAALLIFNKLIKINNYTHIDFILFQVYNLSKNMNIRSSLDDML